MLRKISVVLNLILVICLCYSYNTIQTQKFDLVLQEHSYKYLENEFKQLSKVVDLSIDAHKVTLQSRTARIVTVTAYSPRRQECDDDPLITASLEKVREGTIAVSRNLLRAGWTFGRKVYIHGYGVFVVNDLMNKRFKDRIDIFKWDTNEAIRFGKKERMACLLL